MQQLALDKVKPSVLLQCSNLIKLHEFCFIDVLNKICNKNCLSNCNYSLEIKLLPLSLHPLDYFHHCDFRGSKILLVMYALNISSTNPVDSLLNFPHYKTKIKNYYKNEKHIIRHTFTLVLSILATILPNVKVNLTIISSLSVYFPKSDINVL